MNETCCTLQLRESERNSSYRNSWNRRYRRSSRGTVISRECRRRCQKNCWSRIIVVNSLAMRNKATGLSIAFFIIILPSQPILVTSPVHLPSAATPALFRTSALGQGHFPNFGQSSKWRIDYLNRLLVLITCFPSCNNWFVSRIICLWLLPAFHASSCMWRRYR